MAPTKAFWSLCYWLSFIGFPFLWFGNLFVGPSEYFFQKMRSPTNQKEGG